MVSLTVAGIIVSCVSVSLSKTANVLSKESNNTELIELELQKNKMLPILGYAESRSNGELGVYNNHCYVINNGEDFFNGTLRGYPVLTIDLWENNSDEKGLYTRHVELEFTFGFRAEYGSYDQDTGEFEVFQYYQDEERNLCDKLYGMIKDAAMDWGSGLGFVAFPAEIKYYIFFDYYDIYLKDRHCDKYIIPNVEDLIFLPGKMKIQATDESEKRIDDLPLFISNIANKDNKKHMVDDIIDIAYNQFNEKIDKAEKEYYEIEYY